MRTLKDRVRAIAMSDGPVLITGETGTGKEMIAQALHQLGRRAAAPLMRINCAAFPGTLIEAELFGHDKGAFTGAISRRDGRFVAADGGCLFLDEIGEMSPGAQAKLLRVLADGTLQPLGRNDTITVDVRIISACNTDLNAGILCGKFRADLYYRLKLFHIHVPALRERRDDLPELIEFFCWEIGDRPPPPFHARAWSALLRYSYPGNVRELRNAIRHALALAGDGEVMLDHLPDELRSGSPLRSRRDRPPLAEALRSFEREYILRALQDAGWNKTQAAEMLGLSRKTLWTKLRDLDVESSLPAGEDEAAADLSGTRRRRGNR